ncbi:MAG: hypothetical protein U0441_17080 [Polyangiaceae bacterium]
MSKPNDDIQDLKRRLVLLGRLEGRLFASAEGPLLFDFDKAEPWAVRKIDALVAACHEGPLPLATLRACVDLPGTPLAVTPAFLSAAQRDLRVLQGPRVAGLVRDAGKIFRRHGDLDAAWVAEKQARLDRLAEAARTGAANGAIFGAPAWFERALDVIGLVHGDDARAAVVRSFQTPADEISDWHPSKAYKNRAIAHSQTSGRGQADVWPSGGRATLGAHLARIPLRDDRERALTFVAHAALTFNPAPRDPEGELTFTAKELAMDLGELKKIPDKLANYPVRLGEALALVAMDLGAWRATAASRVDEGLSVDVIGDLVRMKREKEIGELPSDPESAAAYVDWVRTLAPHYASLGLDVPLSPTMWKRFAGARKSDLAVLGLCLMKHHTKADADTADQAIARLDATLALFAKMPADVTAILTELSGTTPGAGRAAMPEIAAWLDDDALLDRYVHLARIAGAPVTLSRTLRADFERGVTIAKEREHLLGLSSRSPQKEARLARLLAGDVAVPSPDRTRRRLADRIKDLLARAYGARLDAVMRRIAKDAWGVAIPRLTPAWRDAIRFYLSVDKNRPLLATVLQTAAAGGDLARLLPKNQAWIASARSRFDVDAWLAPRSRDVEMKGARHRIEIERDPIEVLRMGIPFGTCLSLEDGFNAASTVVNAADANKHVLYLRDADGTILARKLVAVSSEYRLIGYHLYIASTEKKAEITEAFREFCERLAEAVKLPLAPFGTPKQIHKGFWYDDGAVPFDRGPSSGEIESGPALRALGLTKPADPCEEIDDEARLYEALHANGADAIFDVIEGAGRHDTARRAAERAYRELPLARVAEGARRSWLFANEATRCAADAGLGPLLDLVAAVGPRGSVGELNARLMEFPPTAEGALSIASAARAMSRRTGASTKFDCDHLEHIVLTVLPRLAVHLTVADGLALCDRMDPLLAWFDSDQKACASCAEEARAAMVTALLAAYRTAPSPGVVIDRLGSRSGPLSIRAALAIAARMPLVEDVTRPAPFVPDPTPSPAAMRALARLRRRDPKIDARPEMLAALLRQSGGDPSHVTLPVPSDAPFEALGDLLDRLDLKEIVEPWTRADRDLEGWKPSPWEIFHLRRAPSPLRDRLVRDMAAAIARARDGLDAAGHESAQRLAQIGAVTELNAFFRSAMEKCSGPSRRRSTSSARKVASSLDRARAVAREIEGQMASSRADDPMARERARRVKDRPSATADVHDRGLLLAALRTIDAHVKSGSSAPHAPAHDPLANLEQAFFVLREADQTLMFAEDVLGVLHRARRGQFNDGDRMLFKEWYAGRKEHDTRYVDDALTLDLLGDPALRYVMLDLIAKTGGGGIQTDLRTLTNLARARRTPHAADGLLTDLLTAAIDRGDLDLSDLDFAEHVHEAARILCARGVAAGFVEAYRKLRDVAHVAAALRALWASPLRETEEMRTAARLLAEQPGHTPEPIATWLVECLDGKLPLCQTANLESEEPPVKSRRGTPSRARSPSAPSGSRRARKAR